MDFRQKIESITGQALISINPMGGGCVGTVYLIQRRDGQKIVAKVDESADPSLDIEGSMISYLGAHSKLPVPDVIYSSPELLLISYIDGESHFSNQAQFHAAELLAHLHKIDGEYFGFESDTLIGSLRQPNDMSDSWLDFFRETRLLQMGKRGVKAGRLPEKIFRRLGHFCDDLDRWLVNPSGPSLIHGDVWTTNILARDDKIVGFIDPAIYHADPEIELAFIALFGTFREPFFARYQEINPIKPGFFEERKDIYNLYPLLVHVRLFGGGYVSSVDSILRKFGY